MVLSVSPAEEISYGILYTPNMAETSGWQDNEENTYIAITVPLHDDR